MPAKMSLNMIRFEALDHAAYIRHTATPDDLAIIAAYGALVYSTLVPTGEQELAFWSAMSRAAGEEYKQRAQEFHEAHLEIEATLLENETARWVAKLSLPRKAVK